MKELRLECLRLAVQCGVGEPIDTASRFIRFVESGAVRRAPSPEEETGIQQEWPPIAVAQ